MSWKYDFDLLSMQAPENGSQGTPGRQCAQFAVGCLPMSEKTLLENLIIVTFLSMDFFTFLQKKHH